MDAGVAGRGSAVRGSGFAVRGSRFAVRGSRIAEPRIVIECPRVLAVAQHGHAIAEAEDLRDPMRHVKDRDAAVAQVVQHAEQVVGLGGRQRGRGLVEHEDAAIEREGSRDLHELAVRGGQPFHRRLRGERQMQAREQVARAQAHLALEEDPSTPRQLAPGEDVARDGEVGKRHHLLVHHADPVHERVTGSRQCQPSIVEPDLPFVGRDDAGKDLEERRLAGAVLTHQGVRLAGSHAEADARQRPHGSE